MSRAIRLTKVAAFGDFELYHTSASTPEWASLKLVRLDKSARKQTWWLGWNGERLAHSKDGAVLEQHDPDTAFLVCELAQASILTRRPQ